MCFIHLSQYSPALSFFLPSLIFWFSPWLRFYVLRMYYICEHAFIQQVPQCEGSCGTPRQNSASHKEGWVTPVQSSGQHKTGRHRHTSQSLSNRVAKYHSKYLFLFRKRLSKANLSPTVEVCYKEREWQHHHFINWTGIHILTDTYT